MIQISNTEFSIGIQGTPPYGDFLPEQGIQLNQIHSSTVLSNPLSGESADGMIFKKGENFPVLKVADCLPVFAIWEDYIGAAHAGWRGISEGIIENLLTMVNQQLQQLILGPCICKNCYEVGQEVIEVLNVQSEILCSTGSRKRSIDLRDIALKRAQKIAGKDFKLININDCTFESNRLYSYRQNKTIRRNYIWLAETESALHIRQLKTEKNVFFRKKEKN